MKKKNVIIIIMVVLLLCISGVLAFVFLVDDHTNASDKETGTSTLDNTVNDTEIHETTGVETTEVRTPSMDEVYAELKYEAYEWDENEITTTISLQGDKVSVDGDGVSISQKDIIIVDNGQYEIKGTLDDGRIIVDAKDCEVAIRLNGVSINCSYSSAIYSYKSNNTIIFLADGSENSITDGADYKYDDGYSLEEELEPNACLYSKTDLNICGTGKLIVTGKQEQGITCKDTLRIFEAEITVDSVGKGILGKDTLTINKGKVVVNATDDGLHSNGNITISGGEYSISAGDDGIHADLIVACYNTYVKVIESNEGVEGYYVMCENSQMDVTSSDDGFNATDGSGTEDMFMHGGGMHGGMEFPEGGGMEPPDIGDMEFPEGGGMEPPSMGDMEPPESANMEKKEGGSTDNTTISIDDGELKVGIEFINCMVKVNSEGDGIDSNGSLTFNGGEYIIYGPSNSGNAGLDYATNCQYISGTLAVLDVAGMSLVPNECSHAGLDVTLDSYVDKGAVVKISSGDKELDLEAVKKFNHITLITSEMQVNDIYTISVDGKEVTSITLDEEITYIGNSGMGGRAGRKK